jgi:hypothetical protein
MCAFVWLWLVAGGWLPSLPEPSRSQFITWNIWNLVLTNTEIGAAAAVDQESINAHSWSSQGKVVATRLSKYSTATIKTIFLLYARPGVGNAAPPLFASSLSTYGLAGGRCSQL